MKRSLRLTVAAFVLTAFNLSAATLYVSLESTNPVVPYATWATAATNIQDAVDAAKANDTVLVRDGVYSTGSRQQYDSSSNLVHNRVMITNSIRLESVNGPLVTTIMGDGVWNDVAYAFLGTNRCVYLGCNAVLSGFTLTNGYEYAGGGVFCEASARVTNCIITGNSVEYRGGGAYGGTLQNCILGGNEAIGHGGGACSATLNSCILMGNTSSGWDDVIGDGRGGGVWDCTLDNCTLKGNWARYGGGAERSTLNNCVSELDENVPIPT